MILCPSFRWKFLIDALMLIVLMARLSSSVAASEYVMSDDLAIDTTASPFPKVPVENESEVLPSTTPPTWIVNAGFISLSRGEANAPEAFGVYNSKLLEVFNSATANRGVATGPDIMLSRRLGPNWDIEARYFQVDSWNVDHVLHDPNGVLALGYHGFGIAETFSLTDTTRLYNIEVNLRNRQFERWPLIVGFRTMQLHEQFQVAGYIPEYDPGPYTQTNNFLWGCQVGAEPILWRPSDRFQLDGLIKTGIYGGHSYQHTVIPVHSSSLIDSQNSVPFVAELGISGKWAFAKHWSLCVGLELLWVTNMALAIDQSLSIACGPPTTGSIYNKSTAFYGGATVNLECRF